MTWYTCEITKAGHSGDQPGGGVGMRLKDIKTGQFDGIMFGYSGSKEREILATALAALTTDLVVLVDLESTHEWSPIKSIAAAKRETIDW